MLLPLLWSVHMDPTKWPQPEKFRPERFLGENGQVFKPDYLMPFSTGQYESWSLPPISIPIAKTA